MLIKKVLILLMIVSLGIFAVGCSNNIDDVATITEEYAGSGGPGDFYEVNLNLTDQSYSFRNLTKQSDEGNGNFDLVSKTGSTAVYRLDTGDLFVKLSDNMLVVANADSEPGERLTVALKKSDENFGDLIDGTYNLATSMEGAIGEVIVDANSKTVDIKLDMNGDGNYAEEDTFTNLPYSYNDTYNAIELIENDVFKHYGVYYNNEIAVWDSYFWDGTAWTGDGMSVMVKQDTSVNLADYEGEYYFIEVDGENGAFELVYNDPDLEIKHEGETVVSINKNDHLDDRGILTFNADFGDGEFIWHMMALPGNAIVISSTDIDAFEGDGGIVVGIKK